MQLLEIMKLAIEILSIALKIVLGLITAYGIYQNIKPTKTRSPPLSGAGQKSNKKRNKGRKKRK
jgi:hypothetical protein